MELNAFAISSILVAVSNILMAILVFLRSSDRKISIIWGYMCIVVSIWGIGGYKFSTANNPQDAFLWWQFAYVSVVFCPVFNTHFVFRLVSYNKKYLIKYFYLISFVFLFFNIFWPEMFLGDVRFKFGEFYCHHWPVRKNILYVVMYVGLYWFLVLHAFYLLIKHFNESTGEKRNQLKYFIFGSIIGWVGPHGDFLSDFGFNVYPYSNFLIAIYPLIMGYGIIKYHLMDITIVLKKGLVYSIFLGILTACYLLFISILGEFFKGLLGYQSFIVNLIALFVFGLMFNPLRNWIQRILDKRFFNGTLESLDQERQRLQQELFQTEKLAYVGQLASSVVHEIRNPLTAIKTYIEYLPKKYQDEEYRLKFQHILPREIKRIENVVNHLLDLAKPRNLVFRDVSLSQVINETLTLLEESLNLKKIHVEKNFEVKDDIVSADFDQLKQVFLNLFLNSIQAMEEGGVLSIMIDNGLKTLVCVTIRDSGSGIPEEQISKLFTPFATTKEDGIGLGLVITKEIIDAHNGKISVESEEGKGTVFTIQLPGKDGNA